jgi:stage II sporulation protein D
MLVKGKLVGIRITQRGASPRIMAAVVIGTKGTTTVTGSQLQGAFGLLSTWASFTTISASAGPTRPASGGVHLANDLAVLTQLMRVFALPGQTVPVLRGNVVPASRGDRITVQVRSGKNWRRIAGARLGQGGAYTVRVPGAGVYRTVYRGLDGPSVVVP